MTKLVIYEPAMCCSTGVCGPSIDENLMLITSAMEALNSVNDLEAVRYNLSNSPQEFVANKKISDILQEKGAAALPITVIDNEIKKVGEYPSLDEITDYTGIGFVMAGQESGSCGGPGSNCC